MIILPRTVENTKRRDITILTISDVTVCVSDVEMPLLSSVIILCISGCKERQLGTVQHIVSRSGHPGSSLAAVSYR